jgi:hypothetical protein
VQVNHQISNSPYEPRGRVCMEVHCPARKEKYLYVGHVDRLGMHGTWSSVDGQIGTWTLTPVNANPIVGIDGGTSTLFWADSIFAQGALMSIFGKRVGQITLPIFTHRTVEKDC